MTNKEQQALIREAIETMGKAFTLLASALYVPEGEAPAQGTGRLNVESPVKKEEPKKFETEQVFNPSKEELEDIKAPKAENTKAPVNDVEIPEDLESLSYNELKQLAKKVGVKAVGSKKDLISAISGGGEVSEAPKKESKKETKKEEPVEESLEIAEEENNVVPMDRSEDVKEPVKTQEDNTLYDRVASDLEGYSDEELADILSDIGVSPRGKRQALIAKIVTAIEEGKLEWEEDEESTEADTTPVKEDNDSNEEVEILGSDERKKAVEALRDELTEAYNNDDLTDKEILTFLKKYYNNNYTSNDPIEDAELYIDIQCNLIDDEGETHEFEDPYYIGDDAYCCGLQLKQLNDTDLYCEHCGTTYSE